MIYLLILFASCEEYYTPDMDKTDGQLVVDSQITSDLTISFVRLTRSRDFYSKVPVEPVTGAKVELIETGSMIIPGIETGAGYFTFNTIPVPGKKYMLKITINKDSYESEVVTMPPPPVISNLFTEHKELKIYRTNGYGIPYAYTILGRDIFVDLPVSKTLSYFRFDIRSVLEWSYEPAAKGGNKPPTVFGWHSLYDRTVYNIAGPKKFNSTTNMIEKHPLLMLHYNAQDYLQADSLMSHGWILIIEQYGTSSGSYDYHQQLNSQFAADGSLFDPVQTQIAGNISCITDPSKLVFGYFDLNSYRQIRYYMNLTSPNAGVTLRQIFRYPLIPETGHTDGTPPGWWE
jgi:hypothetical protein